MKRDGSKGMSRDAELEYLRERVKELESVSLELRKSGEEVLRVKESLAKAQEVAHLGNWDWDIINNTLYWSDEIYRIFGLKPQEFGATYETFLEAVHPDDRDMVTTGVNKALEENVEYSLDHRVVLSDGTVRWVHEQAVVSLSEDNCPISMVGTVQDITVQYEAEEKVRFLSTLPEENPNPVFRVDLSGVLIFANPSSFSVLKGKEFKVGKKVDKKWLDLVNEAYKSGIVKTVESKLGDKYFLFYVTPVEGGGYVNIYGLDVTSRKLAELELAKISVAIEQSINVIFITDVQGKIDYVNKRFEDVTGYSRDEIIGQTPRVFSSGETPDSVYKDMWSIILSGKTWRGTFKNKKKSGEEYWVNGLIFPVKGADEDIANFLAIQEDITEKMFSEERMSFLKAHDELTGLFNRSKLEKSISHWLDTEKDNKASFIHMDIDNFKFVNDVKGHKSGDEVLKDLADLLRDFINKYDKAPLGELRDQVVISRLGGDEMGLFLPEVSKGDAVKLAEEIRLRVSNEIKFEGDNDLTVSMGVVAYPMQCDSIEQMLIRADAAKYRAKELGQDRVHLYSVDDKVLEDMHSRLNWRTKITDGIEEGRFIPWFQPIMDLKTGKVTHYEALARMLDDNGEVLLPGAFIDVAERFGYIGQIDREITGKVMAVQKETSDSGSPITFSVNLSGKLLNDHGTLDYLRAKIEETGANPKNLVFEITETAAVSDLKVAATFVSELKTLGCKFSLDDFGVGFTSFVYLRELDVDYIKIDGSFIRVIEESENDRLFVKAITDVAKGLGVKTIAEFVGSQEAIDILKDIGVDYVQGYYIGKPAEKLLERE